MGVALYLNGSNIWMHLNEHPDIALTVNTDTKSFIFQRGVLSSVIGKDAGDETIKYIGVSFHQLQVGEPLVFSHCPLMKERIVVSNPVISFWTDKKES